MHDRFGEIWAGIHREKMLARHHIYRSMTLTAWMRILLRPLVAALYEKQGYTARLTPSQSDYGVDVVAENEKEGVACLFQCKHLINPKGSVGPDSVSRVVTARNIYSDRISAKDLRLGVVTNARYTRQSRKEAKANSVELAARREIKALLDEFPISHADIVRMLDRTRFYV